MILNPLRHLDDKVKILLLGHMESHSLIMSPRVEMNKNHMNPRHSICTGYVIFAFRFNIITEQAPVQEPVCLIIFSNILILFGKTKTIRI